MSLFVLGPFTADRVALDGNAMVSGLPALTALAGLSDTLARRLGQPAANWPVGLILHDLQPHAGRAKPKPIYKQHKVVPDEAIERLTGWVRATVVVNDPQDTVTAEEVAEQTPGLRLAGGPLRLERSVRPIEDLGAELRLLPPGHLLVDRTEVLEAAVAEASDPLDGLLDVCARHWDPEEERWQAPWARDQHGRRRYLVPVAAGYQALEPLKALGTRRGTRCPQTPHGFAEGIVSIAELVSARQAARSQERAWSDLPLFWRWQIDAASGVFRVQGSPLNSTEAV